MSAAIAFFDEYDVETLQSDWRALELASENSFFLSWTWIGAWLDSIAAKPVLVRITAEDELIGLGLFARHQTQKLGFIPVRQLVLHATGDADLDRIEVEYNGLLLRSGHSRLWPLVLDHLRRLPWDECLLPGIAAASLPAPDGFFVSHIQRQSPCYSVDLAAGHSVMDRLSANARGQLRRALRLAEEQGPLGLERASDLPEALAFLDDMKKLDRWAASGKEGAFVTPARDAFHRQLIRRGWETGAVELIRARAGQSVLGYLYQFLYRGRVMAYQAAYPPAADNRHRPGLVMHYLAIERARAAGYKVYDFLAGDARYKRSFGSQENTLVWCRLQKPHPLSHAEGMLRRLAGRFRSRLESVTQP